MYCPQCHSQFPSGARCPFDGATLLRAAPSGAAAAPAPAPARGAGAPRPAIFDDPTTIRSHDPYLGRTLGGYRIERRIGEGAMAVVYKARHTGSGREAAVKILRVGAHDDLPARFRREAEVVSLLKSPHTVQLLEHGEADGTLYIAMEYLDGTGLDAELKRGPLDAKRTLGILREVCVSLAEAHALGMIHRDLKPANVFLDRRAGTKVLDFGIAKVTAPPAGAGARKGPGANILSFAQPLTAMGAVMGTPTYMAPEQARDEVLDARTDLYALGVVAYHCLAGRPPFEGAPGDVIFQHTTKSAAPLPSTVDAPIVELVGRLMEKDRGRRPPSAEALIAEIDTILSGGGAPAAVARKRAAQPSQAPARASGASDRRKRTRLGVIAAVVLGVGAIAVGMVAGQRAFSGSTSRPRPPPGYADIPLDD